MKTKMNEVSRRGFLAAGGALAVGAAVFPSLPEAGPLARWTDASGIHLTALRAAYVAEVARFAETLRPRFESGDLRAFRDGDDEEVFRDHKNGIPDSPHWKVEKLCAAHFGLEVARTKCPDGGETFDGDAARAHYILAASPHTESTEDEGFFHSCYHATTAAAWDVIALARDLGWYVPTADETEDPMLDGPCPDCGCLLSCHEAEGCRVHECGCKRPHTPHRAA
jgi:hypothetical protein